MYIVLQSTKSMFSTLTSNHVSAHSPSTHIFEKHTPKTLREGRLFTLKSHFPTRSHLGYRIFSPKQQPSYSSSITASTLEAHSAAMVPLEAAHQICALCGKHASAICKGCKGMPDGAGAYVDICYCGPACRKDHWAKHKYDCKAAQTRKTLYRAGELAKAMFHMMRKAKWKMPIRQLEKVDKTWIVHLHTKSPGKSRLIPFQSALFPEKQDEEAILSWRNCNGAIDLIYDLVNLLINSQSSLYSADIGKHTKFTWTFVSTLTNLSSTQKTRIYKSCKPSTLAIWTEQDIHTL